jgi:hypothetical protein
MAAAGQCWPGVDFCSQSRKAVIDLAIRVIPRGPGRRVVILSGDQLR